MVKRGRIVRDPTAGPGLVMVQGRQHAFPLEGIWQSDALPRPGAVVDVEFDESGRIHGMTVVPEARLAREQVDAALSLARTRATTLASLFTRLGPTEQVALAVLVLCWFWVGAFEIDTLALGSRTFSLWQALGILNAGDPITGANQLIPGWFGICSLVCLCGPLLGGVSHNRRAHLASLSPLLFVLVVAVCLRYSRFAGVTRISPDAGFYVALLAGAQLGLSGFRRFLVARAGDAVSYQWKE